MNKEQLISALKINFEEYGITSIHAEKITASEIVKKLGAFKQIAKALSIDVPFDMETAEDAADELAKWINSCIDYKNDANE